VSIPSPLQPRLRQILGFVAEGRLTRRGCLTALHFRSKQTHTYDFHQTRLRRGRRNSTWRSAAKLVLQLRALVSLVLGSLCQGPRIGFTFPCLPPILCAMLGAPFLPRSSAYRCTPASLGRRLLTPGAFPNGHSRDVLWEEFGIRSHFPPSSAKNAILPKGHLLSARSEMPKVQGADDRATQAYTSTPRSEGCAEHGAENWR